MKTFSQSVSLLLASLLIAGQLPAQSSANLQIHLLDSDGPSAAAGSATSKGFTVQVADDSGNGVADAAVVFRLPETSASGIFADGTHAAVAYTDQNGRAHVSGIQWASAAGVVGIKVTATKGTAHAGILVEETLTGTVIPVVKTGLTVSAPVAEPAAVEPVKESAKEPMKEPTPKPGISVRQPGTLDASGRLPLLKPTAPATSPGVSVTNGPNSEKIHSGSKTKWFILAAVIAAGAGAGIAMAGKSKSSSSTASTGVSIGGPSVSVGAP
ncbi:MAG: hypothetical protein M3Y57_09235 [Acidobacteriota bacterium]|nr:hypothetical protein [Acidobacteriota bacterium]